MTGTRLFATIMFVLAACALIAGGALAVPPASHGHGSDTQANVGYVLMVISVVLVVVGASPFALKRWVEQLIENLKNPEPEPSEPPTPPDPNRAQAAAMQAQIEQQQAVTVQQVQKMRENQ